jgi:hypothetical protein
MMSHKVSIIHERDYLAPISQISPSRRENEYNGFTEYSLTQNEFDPSKYSPPNEFMLKLQLRMSIYNNKKTNNNSQSKNQSKTQIKDDNRVNE